MPKTIPCFICGIGVELHDETAIAALCKEHKTKENIEKLNNAPTSQLLRILKKGIIKEVSVTSKKKTKTRTVNEWGEVV